MSNPPSDRPRSDKDIVPEFEDGDSALDWMEKKLNGSWVDDILEDPKSPRETGSSDLLDLGFSPANTGVTYGGPEPITTNGPIDAPPADRSTHVSGPSMDIDLPTTTSTGYNPNMSGEELAAFLENLWNKNDSE